MRQENDNYDIKKMAINDKPSGKYLIIINILICFSILKINIKKIIFLLIKFNKTLEMS